MSRPIGEQATPRQRQILNWVKMFIRKNDMAPTVREIGQAFDIKSSTVFHLLKALEKKGYLCRGNFKVRSLLIKNREKTTPAKFAGVPVVGRIKAGKPILNVEDHSGTVTVDSKLLRGREGYALQVEGDSMVSAGILDGDYVIIRKQGSAEDGDIVEVFIKDDATFKKLYYEKEQIRLESLNKSLPVIRPQTGEFRIQGKVIAVQRLFETAV